MSETGNLVYQTSTTTGTGDFTLVSVTGFQDFSDVFAGSFWYAIRHQTADEFEVGIGTLDGGLLSRDTVIESSNSNALVNFSAGTKEVVSDVPASTQNLISTSIQPGDNVSDLTNDAGYVDAEGAMDAVGGALADTSSITLTYDDPGDGISADFTGYIPEYTVFGGVESHAWEADQEVDASAITLIEPSSLSGSDRSILSIQPVDDGQLLIVSNVDTSNSINLEHEYSKAKTAFQLSLPDDENMTIEPDGGVIFVYSPNLQKHKPVANLGAGRTQPFQINVTIKGDVENGDTRLVLKSAHALTITETTTICTSGTATATFKINTTALGGTANSVSSSEQSQSHSSANVVAVGDDIVVTISSASSCTDASFSVSGTTYLGV